MDDHIELLVKGGNLLEILGRLEAAGVKTNGSLAHVIKRADVGNRSLDDILQLLKRTERLALTQLHAQAYPLISEIEEFYMSNQLSFAETLEQIHANRLSIARFGDGEMRAMLAPDHALKFQSGSEEMSKDLKEVFTLDGYEQTPLMLALPHLFRGHAHWTKVWLDVWGRVKPLLSEHRKYGNAHVTRPICFQSGGQNAVARWRRLWDGKDVAIIAGKGSRFDLEPALFDCAKSTKFVYSTPTNAYADLDRLLDVVSNDVKKDTVCIIALGPAGTIAAAKLAREGYWALDIGHLSASYATIFNGAPNPEQVPLERQDIRSAEEIE